MTRRQAAAVIGLAAIAIVAVLAEPSLAATSRVGRNVGQEIKQWATALLLGVAGLVAIPVLAKRDVSGGLVLALLVMLIGGFVFAQDAVRGVITNLWRAVGA